MLRKRNHAHTTRLISLFSSSLAIATFMAVIFVALSLPSQAQNSTSSPYSRYGVGELVTQGFGQNRAMGGTGIALRSPNHLNISNPASYSALPKFSFLFDLGLSYRNTRFATENATQTNNNVNLEYLGMGFRVAKWWGVGLGLAPYSSVGYTIEREDDLAGIGSSGTNAQKYAGSGGLSKVFWGNSFKLGKHVSLGVNSSYIFGALKQNTVSTVTGEGESSASSVITETSSVVKDFHFDFGVQYSTKLGSADNYFLTVGATLANSSDIKAYTTQLTLNYVSKLGQTFVDTLIDQTSETSHIEMPLSYGAGLSLRIGEKFNFAADYLMQEWDGTSFLGETPEQLANSTTYAAGMQYIPKWNSLRYFEAMQYRVGVHYTDSYLQFGSEQLTEYGLSFGLGLPLRGSRSTFNVGFEYGQRGTTDNSLIKENYAIIHFNLSLSDVWFVRPKYH